MCCLISLTLLPQQGLSTTKGLSQIVTPDLQPEGDLSLSLQIQDARIANPYELQAELGLTKWAEVAIFQGFKPNEEIFATELGILTKEPYLLSVGLTNWSPRNGVDPQPYIEGGYYTEHNKFIAGAIHAGYKNEAILVTPTILTSSGARRLISRAARKTHPPSGSLGISPKIFRLTRQSTSRTTTPIGSWRTSFSPTPFIFGRKTRRKRTRVFPADSKTHRKSGAFASSPTSPHACADDAPEFPLMTARGRERCCSLLHIY